MKTLRDVFLEMNSHQMHFFLGGHDIFLRVLGIGEVVQWHAAICAKRHVVLRNLIVFRHVRVEIIFAIELAQWGDVAAEHETGERRHAQRLMIHHRQSARQTEANRTSVRIWFGSKFNRTSAKHFGARLELDVHFKTYGGDVVHCRFQIADFKFSDADLRDATKIATNSPASSNSGWTRSAGINFASTINSSQS